MKNVKSGEEIITEVKNKQIETDERRNEIIQNLSKENQEKYKFVEDTLREFQKRNIPIYMFTTLPISDKEYDSQVIQYNNLVSLATYENDNFDTKSKLMLHQMNVGMIIHLINIFLGASKTFKGSDMNLDELMVEIHHVLEFMNNAYYSHLIGEDSFKRQLIEKLKNEIK